MDNERIRKRTVEEDSLLGARTTSFLIGNGFVLTALGANPEADYKSVIAVFGLVMSVLWLLTTSQSWRVIQALHKLRGSTEEVDVIDDAVRNATLWKAGSAKRFLGPSALIATWLPLTVLFLWLAINYLMRFNG